MWKRKLITAVLTGLIMVSGMILLYVAIFTLILLAGIIKDLLQ